MSIKTARRNLIRNNRRASLKSLIEQGFKLVSVEKVNFSHTTETWMHHDGTTAKIESLNLNLIRYIAPDPAMLVVEAEPAKAERTRAAYTLDKPIVLGSRLKRLLAPLGFTAAFNRQRAKWLIDGRGLHRELTVEGLLTVPGSRVLNDVCDETLITV